MPADAPDAPGGASGEDAAPAVTTIERAVRRALDSVIDPEIRKPVTELDMVDRVVEVASGRVEVGIRLTIVGCPASDRIERDVRQAAESVVGPGNASVELSVMTPAQRAALTERLRGGRAARGNPFGPGTLTKVIAVTSGKGGV
ncbi:MAG TPA: iron-sulfur cluster assembly protein, partial [Agromyces sp.]